MSSPFRICELKSEALLQAIDEQLRVINQLLDETQPMLSRRVVILRQREDQSVWDYRPELSHMEYVKSTRSWRLRRLTRGKEVQSVARYGDFEQVYEETRKLVRQAKQLIDFRERITTKAGSTLRTSVLLQDSGWATLERVKEALLKE